MKYMSTFFKGGENGLYNNHNGNNKRTSTIRKVINFKKEGKLLSPDLVAEKLIELLNAKRAFPEHT